MTEQQQIEITTKYSRFDEYELQAKIGDIIWVGYVEDNFNRASLKDTYNVVGKDSKGLIVTRNGSSKKLRFGADSDNQMTFVVKKY